MALTRWMERLRSWRAERTGLVDPVTGLENDSSLQQSWGALAKPARRGEPVTMLALEIRERGSSKPAKLPVREQRSVARALSAVARERWRIFHTAKGMFVMFAPRGCPVGEVVQRLRAGTRAALAPNLAAGVHVRVYVSVFGGVAPRAAA